jgi:hypothetical protein
MNERREPQRVTGPPAVDAGPPGTPPAPSPPRKARLFSWRPSRAGILHLLAICMIVFGVWALAHDHLSAKSWRVPASLRDDDVLVLTWFRAASEFDFVPFASRTVSRLGAPYQANWNDYPMYEPVVIFLIGMVARWTDLITASNIGILASFLASAVSFYVCCRLLRWRREWSAAGALLFAFSYYHTSRGLGHLLLTYDYTVPLAVMGAWLLTACRRVRIGDRVFWLCAGIGLLLGMGNPYNLFMWLQFLCLGLGIRFLRLRRKADLALGTVIIAITLLGFLAVDANTLCYQMRHGENQRALWRGYHQLEISALKPIELVLPPWEHRLTWLGDISRKYWMEAWVKGEMFSPYLGVVGLLALVWLMAEFGLRVLNPRTAPRRFPSHAPLCSWIMLFSAIGGVNCWLGLVFGMMYFRGSNRYSIFILAIALFFLVSRLSRLARRWNRGASYALALVVVAVGLLDQLPSRAGADAPALARAVENDQRFCRALEEKLPPGAMIFQLPRMVFPEAYQIQECQPYEHLRPYLWTKHLRFSFGSVQGRTREDWQVQLAALHVDQAVQELERYGFAGLYLNRKAWKDRGEGMLQGLASCGKSQLIEDDAHDQVCVMLNPSPNPARPPNAAAQIVYKHGWVMEEAGPDGFRHWAGGKSSIYFVNDHSQSGDFRLIGVVAAMSPRRVDIQFDGKTIWSEELGAKDGREVDLRLHARPGRNYVYFSSDRPPEPRLDQEQAIRAAQGILKLQIVKDPPAQP